MRVVQCAFEQPFLTVESVAIVRQRFPNVTDSVVPRLEYVLVLFELGVPRPSLKRSQALLAFEKRIVELILKLMAIRLYL